MSQNIRKTAQGKSINMDNLLLANETIVAVGNMKVNARGDELGPGGSVLRTRDQVMAEYYASNAVYTKEKVEEQREKEQAMRGGQAVQADEVPVLPQDILEQDAIQDEVMAEDTKLRGNLADAVAKTAKVDQKLLTPKKTNSGPSRI
jgi:glycyl-tRNA synthetase (class II)